MRVPQALQPCWWRGTDLRQHKVLRVLGGGAFGSVALAEVQLADGSTRQMAVKSLYHRGDHGYAAHVVQQEVDGMMAMQGCPYAVQLYGSSLDYLPKEERSQPQHTYELYMEVADKGTLANELVRGLGCWRLDGLAAGSTLCTLLLRRARALHHTVSPTFPTFQRPFALPCACRKRLPGPTRGPRPPSAGHCCCRRPGWRRWRTRSSQRCIRCTAGATRIVMSNQRTS